MSRHERDRRKRHTKFARKKFTHALVRSALLPIRVHGNAQAPIIEHFDALFFHIRENLHAVIHTEIISGYRESGIVEEASGGEVIYRLETEPYLGIVGISSIHSPLSTTIAFPEKSCTITMFVLFSFVFGALPQDTREGRHDDK